ncbi:Probable carboxylesterase 18 [Linum grandiflorum]
MSTTGTAGSTFDSTPITPPPPAALPWRTRLAVSVISALSDTARRHDGTVNRRLLNFLDLKSPSSSTPIQSVVSSDVTVDASRNLWFRLYTPTAPSSSSSSSASLPIFVFFHGGGFAFLSPASVGYDLVCRRFARTLPAIVVSVNYRLTPEHRFPCQYEDGFDILRFLDADNNGDRDASVLPPNADITKCFLAGDSAGANLAHHVAVRAGRVGQDKFRRLRVIGQVSIQPFFGGEERSESEIRFGSNSMIVSLPRTDWMWKAFLPEGSNRDHKAANVSGANAEDISGVEYPDTMVIVGGLDPLQDWQRKYYKWLKRMEKEATLIEYPNMIHAFYMFPELPESAEVFAQVKDFVARKSAA